MSYFKSLFLASFLFLSLSIQADHIVVDQWQYIPDVSIEVTKDNFSGYNLKVDSTNFIFDPVNASGEHMVGHGHGHLYINGKKVNRLYNKWTHIPVSWLKKGHNEIVVTLNANTHEELWYRNLVISDKVIIHFDGSNPSDGHHHGHH